MQMEQKTKEISTISRSIQNQQSSIEILDEANAAFIFSKQSYHSTCIAKEPQTGDILLLTGELFDGINVVTRNFVMDINNRV